MGNTGDSEDWDSPNAVSGASDDNQQSTGQNNLSGHGTYRGGGRGRGGPRGGRRGNLDNRGCKYTYNK